LALSRVKGSPLAASRRERGKEKGREGERERERERETETEAETERETETEAADEPTWKSSTVVGAGMALSTACGQAEVALSTD
jgi:hypothetical protein